MGKALKNAKRLDSYLDWEFFQREYPEIKLVKDYRGKIIRIHIPEEYIVSSLLFSPDKREVILLSFINPEHPDELVLFSP